jgi:Zn-dependent M28 family amino/carboxypeptidase
LGYFTPADPEDQPPGIAVVLEVARALSQYPIAERSFVFLNATAESEGLLGLNHYLENPMHPLDRTRAALHMAGFGTDGDQSYVSIIGTSYQALRGLVREQAVEQFRSVFADTDPGRLYFFRSGEAVYTEHEIPSIFLTSRGLPEPAQDAELAGPPDMSVAVLDAQLLFHIGRRVATTGNWPDWKPFRPRLLPGVPEGVGRRDPGMPR